MKIKKITAAVLAAVLAVNTGIVSVYAGAETSASGVNVSYRTQEEIADYIAKHPFDTASLPTYERNPDLTPPYEDAGKLGSDTLNNGLNALNVMRYIAGLDEVTLNDSYNNLCQHGSYINNLNGGLSHTPKKPDGVSDSIYDLGKQGCGSSNLARGTKNLAGSVLLYMNDSDNSNISAIGHRRWCMNPTMKEVGFGQVGMFQSMYAFDRNNEQAAQNGVCWPAQNMPVDYFGTTHAWSYSLGSVISNPNDIKVTLTRTSDNKVWTFSSSSTDNYFSVDNQGYGQPGCIIFRPGNIDGYKEGDIFNVKIDGLGTPVEYTVNFFSPKQVDSLPAVTNLATSTSKNSITLSWDAVPNASYYTVEMLIDGNWYVTDPREYEFTSIIIGSLVPDVEYQFRVTAYSNTASGTPATIKAKTLPDSAVKGDVDGDGKITAKDAAMVLKMAGDLLPKDVSKADVNGDNLVNARDAVEILKKAAGMPSALDN